MESSLSVKLSKLIPKELQEVKQWVVWRLEKRGEKTTKVPYQVNNPSIHASSTNPDTWGSFSNALKVLETGMVSGIGFVFSASDNYVGIDLDSVRDDGVTTKKAWDIINSINSYTEVSPSGNGVHIIAKTTEEINAGYKGDGLEIYDRSRYFTVTGDVETLFGDEERPDDIRDATKEIKALLKKVRLESLKEESQEDAYIDWVNTRAEKGGRYDASARVAGSILARTSESAWETIGFPAYVNWCKTMTDPNLWEEDEREARKTWENIKKKHLANNLYSRPTEGDENAQGPTPLEQVDSVNEFSDLANVLRIVRDYGHEFRYANYGDSGKWMRWDGKSWVSDLTVTGYFAQKLSISLRREYTPELAKLGKKDEKSFALDLNNDKQGDKGRAAKIKKFIMSSESASRINALPKLLQPRLSVAGESFDAIDHKITVNNGTLNLNTFELEDFNPENLLTKLIPTDYKKDAQCPTWEMFMSAVCCGDKDLVNYLQKVFGYSITASVAEQKLWLLYGEKGANGKSTMMNVIKTVLGRDIASTAPNGLLLEKKFDEHPTFLMSIKGKRLIDIEETPLKGRLNVNLLKQLTGGDEIQARSMRQDFTVFRSEAKFMFVTNYRPSVDDMGKALWRRLRVVEFKAVFDGQNEIKDYHLELLKEKEGILRWIVDGLKKYKNEGLKEPEAVLNATRGYQNDSDSVGAFVRDFCIVDNDKKVPLKVLYEAYEVFCEEDGIDPVHYRSFSKNLESAVANIPGSKITISKVRSKSQPQRFVFGIDLA